MIFPEEFSFHTREWFMLKALLEKDLDAAVGELCNISTDEPKTQQLRGRIGYIKNLLDSAAAAARERQR